MFLTAHPHVQFSWRVLEPVKLAYHTSQPDGRLC